MEGHAQPQPSLRLSGYPQTAPSVLRRSGRHALSVLMTNYPYKQDPNDTLDEAYMRWLDQNGFPAMQQLLGGQGCEDVAVLRSVPNQGASESAASADRLVHAAPLKGGSLALVPLSARRSPRE